MVPRVTKDGKHHVCNRIDNKLEETDGTGYRDWFNEQNRITGGNLKKGRQAAEVPEGPQEQLHGQVDSADYPRWQHHQTIG